MTLQLHDNGLEGRSWFRRAAQNVIRYAPNPYYQAARFAYRRRPQFLRENMDLAQEAYEPILAEIVGTPTYEQFINETGLSEEDPQLAGKFGTWLKTKAVPGLQKIQQKFAPVIGLLPGGGTINTAFDILKRPQGSDQAVQVLPTPSPELITPNAPAPPNYMAPPPYDYAAAPMPLIKTSSGLTLDKWFLPTMLALGGGLVLYLVLRKKNKS